jgi:hypothetical protein
MNNKYKIKVESPLLRAGLSIETETSEKYLVPVLNKLMGLIRIFNTEAEPKKAREGEDD